MAAAERIACGPTPAYSTTAVPGRSPPVPGQFSFEEYTLLPPPPGTKPAICADAALAAIDPRPAGPDAARPAHVWLADFSAQTPAHINPDNSITPYFADVLAWVFVFTDLSPMVCAGPPGAPCHTASARPSSEIASVDATTGKAMTNEQISGPAPDLHWPPATSSG